ncbi:hypothetical protein [Vibrio brasiliensis]
MDIRDLEKGMLVECRQGVGVVVETDESTHAVVIEDRSSHQKFEVDVEDLIDEPQIHHGCERYY